MLNADDEYTPVSLNRLKRSVRQGRPLVVWVGAGASQWAGLPLWCDSAKQMRRTFVESVSRFPLERANKYFQSGSYPEFFQLCRDTDEDLFNRALVEQFTSPTPGPIYAQLIDGLNKIAPVQIVTTNIDLCLEQALGSIDVIEGSDLERCTDSIVKKQPFVGKLHGSVSAIHSVVFTSSQYRQIVESKSYVAAMKSIFATASVLFLGYGLKDDYVLKLLAESDAEHRLFGSGPHFRLTSTPGPPEDGIHRICYSLRQHKDHRAALTVFDVVHQVLNPTIVSVTPPSASPSSPKGESQFYISDFRPSGTHISGQLLELNNPENKKINAVVGLGFVQGELPSSATVAFHDLAVGLTCFDRVFLPLTAVGSFHLKATQEVFFALMGSGAIKFVDIVHEPFYVSLPGSLTGDISIVRIQDPEQEETRSSMTVVRRFLSPLPGKEAQGNALIEGLASSIVSFEDSASLELASMVRGALLLPRVSQLLGFSDFSLPNTIPRWLAHPTLRFAHLVQTGLICNRLGIRATRVPFGGASLLSAAFGVEPGESTAYESASFVLTGAFGSNLSDYIEMNPSTLLTILKFRESAEGEALRREVADRLERNDGKEFSTAIEGSLKRAVPAAVLQAAKNKFSALIKARSGSASADVIWADRSTGDSSLCRWRARSRELLMAEVRQRGLRQDSLCLCGSGDRLRDCCIRPLT